MTQPEPDQAATPAQSDRPANAWVQPGPEFTMWLVIGRQIMAEDAAILDALAAQ